MFKEKKQWETPKLICLYRGRPEEAVLVACKGAGAVGPKRPLASDCTHPSSGPCSSTVGT